MKPDRTKVCAVVVSYNSAEYLPACFESLKRQTHPGFEVVLVDNGSSDSSVEIARRFGVRPFSQPIHPSNY